MSNTGVDIEFDHSYNAMPQTFHDSWLEQRSGEATVP